MQGGKCLKGSLLSELGSLPSTLPVVTAVKRILTDACRKQHTVTFTQEDNHELPGDMTTGRYPIYINILSLDSFLKAIARQGAVDTAKDLLQGKPWP